MRNGAYQVWILSVNSIERTERNVRRYWKKHELLPAKLLVSKTFVPLLKLMMSVLPTHTDCSESWGNRGKRV